MLLCLWAHELRLLADGVGRIRLRLLLLPVLASHVFAFEGALGVADRIMAHLLIAEKAGALHRAFRGGNLREHIRIEFVLDAVPEQFLALVDESVHDVADTDSAAQMPQFLLIIIPRRIRLDISLNVEFLVELFEKRRGSEWRERYAPSHPYMTRRKQNGLPQAGKRLSASRSCLHANYSSPS